MCVYQKCPTRFRYDGGGGGGSRMLNHRLILSRTIQIKILVSLCASIKNVLFATGTIGQGIGIVWGDFL